MLHANIRIFGGMDAPKYALTRIAPTPSGFLHFGNGFSFVLTALLARKTGARLALRIDDLDRERYRHEYLSDIFSQLDWLGIEVDEGPSSPDDFEHHHSQHLRLDRYLSAIDRLITLKHLYRCRCSRKDFASREGVFCDCRLLSIGPEEDSALRLNMLPDNSTLIDLDGTRHSLQLALNPGPVPILQKNGLPAYQIASVVDDLEMGTDLIVRGIDLLPSSGLQLHIASLLGENRYTAADHLHHRLVFDGNEKMSKSAGSTSLQHFRKEGGSVDGFYRWMTEDWPRKGAASTSHRSGREWLAQLDESLSLDDLLSWSAAADDARTKKAPE